MNIFSWMKRAAWQVGALALLAMLVRAIVPAGYMLAEAQTANGRYLVVQMCDGHAGTAQIIDLDTGKIYNDQPAPNQDKSKSSDAPCVFAVATPMSPPQADLQPLVFLTEYVADFTVVLAVSPGRGIAAPPPPATGPPALI